jgi:hypothetical protein
MRVVLAAVAVLLAKSACTAPTPSPTPCQVPRNCGQHNNTVVCGHKFTGCEFTCAFCCEPYYVGINCDPCTEAKCKPVPPLPPSTTYDCLFPSIQCKQIAGSSGQFNSSAACAKVCVSPTPPPAPPTPAPPPPCTGNSSGLNAVSCAAWQDFAKATNIAGWTKCSGALLDPCSCKIAGYGVICADGDITQM